mgnify:FL=1
MNTSKNINKKVNILFFICLISILTLAAGASFLMLASIPILLAAIGLDYGPRDLVIVFIGSFLVGLIFESIKSVTLFYIPILILSLIQIGLIKSKFSDKKQILINFVLTSFIFIAIYKYQMLEQGLTINDMAAELKEVLAPTVEYEIPDELYKTSFAMYPSILSALPMLYSLFSLKIVRNYLAYKNKASDMKNLNKFRISKREFAIMLAIAAGLYFILSAVLNIEATYISANLFSIVTLLLILNGILTYDYLTMSKAGILSRGMKWFFIIIFFYFFMIIFLMLGIADIFVDFRSKPRRIDAK